MTGQSDEHWHRKASTVPSSRVQLDRTPIVLIPLSRSVSLVIPGNPKRYRGPGGRKLKPKLVKELLSTCYGSGCNFHSIQGCFADKRLRGDRCLAFISELRQKGMGEHCQGFERQRAQEFASNGAKPLNCLFGT